VTIRRKTDLENADGADFRAVGSSSMDPHHRIGAIANDRADFDESVSVTHVVASSVRLETALEDHIGGCRLTELHFVQEEPIEPGGRIG